MGSSSGHGFHVENEMSSSLALWIHTGISRARLALAVVKNHFGMCILFIVLSSLVYNSIILSCILFILFFIFSIIMVNLIIA